MNHKPTPSRDALLAWYGKDHRALPWRPPPGRLAAPYPALVSEIMLQQTTVATVLGRFGPFIDRFPGFGALASAPIDDVLHAWQGLGYYRRARGLHACAGAIQSRHGGDLPESVDMLRALPGIGEYTANALAAMVHGQPALGVDGNVRRVIARLFAIDVPVCEAGPAIADRARGFVDADRPGDFQQAIMELGATVCRPGKPKCGSCPWQTVCVAHQEGLETTLPIKNQRRAKPVKYAWAFYLRRPDGTVLFRRRPDQGLLAGMIELPSSPWQSEPVTFDEALKQAPAASGWTPLEPVIRHVFTHFEIRFRLAIGTGNVAIEGIWATDRDRSQLALPTLTRKMLDLAGRHESL
ncbi:MAG: A/G-specific adenine glycosylase [Geminicoccaceae bacterium]